MYTFQGLWKLSAQPLKNVPEGHGFPLLQLSDALLPHVGKHNCSFQIATANETLIPLFSLPYKVQGWKASSFVEWPADKYLMEKSTGLKVNAEVCLAAAFTFVPFPLPFSTQNRWTQPCLASGSLANVTRYSDIISGHLVVFCNLCPVRHWQWTHLCQDHSIPVLFLKLNSECSSLPATLVLVTLEFLTL